MEHLYSEEDLFKYIENAYTTPNTMGFIFKTAELSIIKKIYDKDFLNMDEKII